MKDNTYNGHKNYETWSVALFIDNEQYTQEEIRELVASEVNLYRLADRLKDYVTDIMCEGELREPCLASQLLQSALDNVAWTELAHKYQQEVIEEKAHNDNTCGCQVKHGKRT